MIYSIIWSPDAITTFEDRIQYLKIHWTEREIKNFNHRVQEYLDVLIQNPFIGSASGRQKNIYI